MERIRLKDGTEYELADGSSLKKLRMKLNNMTEVIEAVQNFTDENLSRFSILINDDHFDYENYTLGSVSAPIAGISTFCLMTIQASTEEELRRELAEANERATTALRAAVQAQQAQAVAEEKYEEAKDLAVAEKARADSATIKANTATEKYEQAKADLDEAEATIVEKEAEVAEATERAETAEADAIAANTRAAEAETRVIELEEEVEEKTEAATAFEILIGEES